MKLTPPKQITFWISVILAVVGVLGTLVQIPIVSGIAIWLVVVAFALLAIALVVKGL